MKRFLFHFFSLSFCISPLAISEQVKMDSCHEAHESTPLVVKSGEANYDGNEITLVGDVIVQHGLGQIKARSLSLKPTEERDWKNKFILLKMKEHVEIELHRGGKLFCSEAEVDYSSLKGVFWGNPENPDVIYSNFGEKKFLSNETPPLLEVKSKQMSIKIAREPSSSSSMQTFVQEVQSIDSVRVNYDRKFELAADLATYERLPSNELAEGGGVLTLLAGESLPACKMTTSHGDSIEAKTIKLDSFERYLWMEETKGVLSMQREDRTPHRVEFSSDELAWDDRNQVLYLYGQVSVTQNGTVRINTDQKLSIGRKVLDGKSTLSFIHVPQRTEIVYLDSQKNVKHQMTCPGSLLMDHEKKEMILKGMPANDIKEESQQVYMDDDLGEMYADHVYVSYEWDRGVFIPRKVILNGNVRLLNRFNGHVQESASVLHYALADEIEYYPEKMEMILHGKEENRVLFFDKVNRVQMSAQSLTITRHEKTKKELIRGSGDVRFTFMDQELQQLKSRFRLE